MRSVNIENVINIPVSFYFAKIIIFGRCLLSIKKKNI